MKRAARKVAAKLTIRCQALDNNLHRCGNAGDGRVIYHGDPEIYTWDGPEPKTVVAYLCPKHRRPR